MYATCLQFFIYIFYLQFLAFVILNSQHCSQIQNFKLTKFPPQIKTTTFSCRGKNKFESFWRFLSFVIKSVPSYTFLRSTVFRLSRANSTWTFRWNCGGLYFLVCNWKEWQEAGRARMHYLLVIADFWT